jgi:hypothetical protein
VRLYLDWCPVFKARCKTHERQKRIPFGFAQGGLSTHHPRTPPRIAPDEQGMGRQRFAAPLQGARVPRWPYPRGFTPGYSRRLPPGGKAFILDATRRRRVGLLRMTALWHFRRFCGPGFYWRGTFSAEKPRKGWGAEGYSKSGDALRGKLGDCEGDRR